MLHMRAILINTHHSQGVLRVRLKSVVWVFNISHESDVDQGCTYVLRIVSRSSLGEKRGGSDRQIDVA